MPKNKVDPKLKVLLKECDSIKKKTNKFIKDGLSKLAKFEKKKLSEKEIKILHEKCKTEINTIEGVLTKLNNIEPVDENINKESFDELKNNEINRQKTSIDEVRKISDTLFPPSDDEISDTEEVSEIEDETEQLSAEESDEDVSKKEEDDDEVIPDNKVVKSDLKSKKGKKDKPLSEEEDDDEEDEDTDEADGVEMMKTSKPPMTMTFKKRLFGKSKQQSNSKPPIEKAKEVSEEEPESEDSIEEGEDEEVDEDTENEDEDEDDDENSQMTGKYKAIGDFKGQEKGDLTFKSGDIFNIISARSDGWLHAVTESGEKGLVPKNYLQKYADEEDEDVTEQISEDETQGFEEDTDSYIDDESETDSENTRPVIKNQKSAKDLWANIKKGVNETNVKDVLNALGALPLGFSTSTLDPLQQKACNRLEGYLNPQLNVSNLGYRDLFFDSPTNKIKSIAVSTQRIVTVTQIRQMPPLGDAFNVVDRFIRICLFDGTSMLSNIITIKAQGVDKDQRTWNFNNKISDIMKSLEYSEFFIRTNSMNTNLGILIEASIVFIRKSNSKMNEVSCGWVNLPLYDSDPKPVSNRTYDVMLNGGTCFEHGHLVDPNLPKKNEGSLLRNLMSSNKQPHISIRLTLPTKQQKILMDTLPEIIIASSCYIQYMSLYREILTDALVRDRFDLHSTDLVHGPIIASFPKVCDQSDIMDVLRLSWAEYQSKNKRSISSLMSKKDPEYQKEQFKTVFMKNIFPLLEINSIPKYNATDTTVVQSRETEIKQLKSLDKSSPIYLLTSGTVQHRPFDITELCHNPIGPNCLGPIR